jgi:glycosyltransferase involved in cell wall biosynthesis
MAPATSVIVSTYRREDALLAVLAGLSRQHDRNFEVIVADDGSGPETAEVVARATSEWPGLAISHVRQEDDGFRLARARNLAVRAARGDRLLFLDGDCVPRPGFVGSHRHCVPGRATCGRRCLLSEPATAAWLDDPTRSARSTGFWLRRRLAGDVNRLPFLADPWFAPLGRPCSWKRFRGMNHGVHRRDYLAVDGNDQAFVGWGFEDSDLAIRLQNSGVRLVPAGLGSTVFHLWHREADRTLEGENRARLDEVRTSGRIRAVEGLSTIAEEPSA